MDAIKISKQYSSEYVCCLPEKIENKIKKALIQAIDQLHIAQNEKQEAIENAYNEKVTNLTDTIKIEWV